RGAGPGVARGLLAAHPGRDPLARGVARSGPPLRGAGGLTRPGCSGATVEPGARVSSPRMTTVLVVDDEPDIVYFAQVNLELSGYEVLQAADGEHALEMVRAHHPDVVLLDVMMPKLDGWGVLEQLKADEDPTVRTIPVVMLTALRDDQHQV